MFKTLPFPSASRQGRGRLAQNPWQPGRQPQSQLLTPSPPRRAFVCRWHIPQALTFCSPPRFQRERLCSFLPPRELLAGDRKGRFSPPARDLTCKRQFCTFSYITSITKPTSDVRRHSLGTKQRVGKGMGELVCIRACKSEPANLLGSLSLRSQARAYAIRIHSLFWRWVNNLDCHSQADFHLQTTQWKKK